MIVFSTTVTLGDIVVVVNDLDTGVCFDKVVTDVGDEEDVDATVVGAAIADVVDDDDDAAAAVDVTDPDIDLTVLVDAAPKAYGLKLDTAEDPTRGLDNDVALILFFKFVNLLLNGETTKFSKFL